MSSSRYVDVCSPLEPVGAALFVERLRAVVQARGSATAVACAGEPALTYCELWDRALAVAADLLARGVSPGEAVVLHLEKSPELVVGMVGCWMVRAAFVPVLPELPLARRTAMVAETRARLALVADVGSSRVAWLAQRCAMIAVERRHELDTAPETFPIELPAASANDRAYVIYTSGSTGQPKGIAVSHRGIVPLLDAQIRAFDLRAGDRCLWMLSPAFDASISDVGTALLAGATLHIEHPARLRSPASLLDVLRARAITHVDLPPSLLPLLDPTTGAPPSLRTIVIGGEVCAPAAVRAWASRVRVVNVYGPTEATVCSTLCVCDVDWQRPLLGQPLPGVELRVEDGELWIGGPAVADGYLGQPELTAAKFVDRDGIRWFRTGDRIVRHSDGELEFLGRIDRQLKVNGVLIAPEEIEARLREHPAVADAVIVLDRHRGRDRLIAYCVMRSIASSPAASSPRRLIETALRAHLAHTIDPRMQPRRFAFVDQIPRSESGKLDLAALVADVSTRRAEWAARPSRPQPQTTVGLFADLWCRVLDLDEMPAVDDHFFELGGDSFAVIELVALADLAELRIAIEDVYAHPTLDELAQCAARVVETSRTCADLRADVLVQRDVPHDGLGHETVAHSRRTPIWRCPDDVMTAASNGVPIGARPDDVMTARINGCVEDGDVTRRLSGQPDTILITGATGFLGRHVVARLLSRTASSLVCIVRGADNERAAQRLARAVESIGIDGLRVRCGMRERVDVVAGDVALPQLGLADAEWRKLAEEVDTIIHCAAEVSLAKPYEQLRGSNVSGAANVLVLARTGRGKTIHHASTLSVFVGSDREPGVLREDDPIDSAIRLYGGYAQSKWAAECMFGDAARSYRFGLLTGHTETGALPERDWLTWFVRGLARVGAYPRIDGARVDLTPVDFAARAIVDLVLAVPAARVFHIANPVAATLEDIVDAIRRAGVAMAEVSIDEFRDRVGRTDGELLAATLLGACRAGDHARVRPCDVFQASGMTFDMTNTRMIVREMPSPGPELLAHYVTRMLLR